MKSINRKDTKGICTLLLALACAMALSLPAMAQANPAQGIGMGSLFVDENNATCPDETLDGWYDLGAHPLKYDVFPDKWIHIKIKQGFGACSATSSANAGGRCTADTDCQNQQNQCQGSGGKTPTYKCTGGYAGTRGQTCNPQTGDPQCWGPGTCILSGLECSGNTSVIIKGVGSTPCTQNSDCTVPPLAGCDTEAGFCKVHDYVFTSGRVGNGDIDVCWRVREDMCKTATVAYCNDVGLLSNRNHPVGSQNFAASGLRAVDEDGEVIEDCERVIPDCTNRVGSFCCSLSQGAYGAPKSAATANCKNNDCNQGQCGFIDAAACAFCDVFASSACTGGQCNATTAGIPGTRSVTLDNKPTLISYLPSGGTAGAFKSPPVGPNTHYDQVSQIPDMNNNLSNSKGQGAGVLAGQSMAARLNSFLSTCGVPWPGNFMAENFGGFQLPADGSLVCTKTSGSDKILGTADDVCRAFRYPSCTWGQTVDNVLAATNWFLAGQCPSDPNCLASCTATDLSNALANANEQFNGCGHVIQCPASQTGPGEFPCGGGEPQP